MDRNCLGNLIEACKSYGINNVRQDSVPCYVNGNGPGIQVGPFVFGSNSHSTGISVNVQILNPDSDEAFEILNGTYWYSESTYGFNKFKRLSGKWDNAFRDAQSELRSLLIIKLHEDAIQEDTYMDKNRLEAQQKVDRVESIFKN